MGKKYDEKQGQVGKTHKVQPIKSVKDIQKIKQYLMGKKSKRDYALFVVGINIGLRASDLVKLRVEDVYDMTAGKCRDCVEVVELKTGKDKKFVLNKAAKSSIELYLKERVSCSPDDWLFLSQKKGHLDVKSVNRFVRELCRGLGVEGRYGSHSLRKTFGYHAYINNIQKDPGFINTLQVILNHSSPSVTLRYIDIDDEKIENVYHTLNL